MTAYQAELDAYEGCPSQCQVDSQLRQMFPSLHYEGGGFFDGDVWEIDTIGRTDTFLGLSDDWWMIGESESDDNGGRGGSHRYLGNAYVENTGGNSGEPVPNLACAWPMPVPGPESKQVQARARRGTGKQPRIRERVKPRVGFLRRMRGRMEEGAIRPLRSLRDGAALTRRRGSL